MRYYIETLGCQMNKLDSEVVAGVLERMNYQATTDQAEGDVAILNTCSVREHAEVKAISRLGHFDHLRRTTGKPSVIVIMGCFAQRSPEQIKKQSPFIDIICGPGELHDLGRLITQAREAREARRKEKARIAVSDFREIRAGKADYDEALEQLDLCRSIETGRFQRFVRVQRGCDNFCTYCIVPYARGPECSRPVANILEEVKQIDQTDCQEITLLGQTVSAYRWTDNGSVVDMAELIHRVHEACSIPRVRFVTSYPGGFSLDIFHAMAELPRVCPYLHLPAQHGSNRMLTLMNRKYTIEEYLELLEQGRKIVPNLSIASDFIVGFPTETEEDHQRSVELVRNMRYKNCFIFKYSIRPGTLAEKRYGPIDEIPEEVKSRRHAELLETQNEISNETNQATVGQTLKVLVEGRSKKNRSRNEGLQQLISRTEEDKIVIFDGQASLIGSITQVKIASASALTLFGESAGTEK
jgi:tRNA-2-methylthio-N6-dimethylallyladenosine synthase